MIYMVDVIKRKNELSIVYNDHVLQDRPIYKTKDKASLKGLVISGKFHIFNSSWTDLLSIRNLICCLL